MELKRATHKGRRHTSFRSKPRRITTHLTVENSAPSAPVDRISDLPDDLLSHILSFLSIKLAFTTKVLSKRWTPLFKSLTTLHFDDESVHDVDVDTFLRFCGFVDKVMLSTQLIKTFHLKCGSKHWNEGNNHFIDSWIETAKQHPMEIIEISTTLTTSMLISLPLSIFRVRTLVVLKLNRLKVVGMGNISVDLPSLKTLHLIRVYLKNRDNFHKLLNGCPILEDLIAYTSYTKSNTGILRELKTLPKLIRADIKECNVPFTTISNIEVLKLTMMGRLSEVETSSYFRGILVCQNLIHLDLSFCEFHHWDNVIEVLQSCPKLQILSFNKLTYSNNQNLQRNWKDPNSVPRCISSHLKSCTIYHNGKVDELQFATYILRNAPLLEVMKIITDQNRDALGAVIAFSPNCKLLIFG